MLCERYTSTYLTSTHIRLGDEIFGLKAVTFLAESNV